VVNKETADHYNTLWDRVNRTKLKLMYKDIGRVVEDGDDDALLSYGIVIEGGFASESYRVSYFMRNLAANFSKEAIREELQLAAKEGRRADVSIDLDNPLTWGLYNGHHKGAGGILAKKILPELLEVVRQLNNIAELNFNCYRMLCEQGVATPPGKESDVS